jgi:group I intron endonuclease
MTGYVYKITNLLNNKKYIGATSDLVRRMYHHYKCNHHIGALHNAIKKYGAENFIVEIVEQPSIEILYLREKYWIKFYNTYNDGYNLTLGGDGGATYGMLHKKHSSQTKEKISRSLKGRIKGPLSKEHKDKISKTKSGKKQSEEFKYKVSIALKGRKLPLRSENHKKNLSNALKGRIAWNKGNSIAN